MVVVDVGLCNQDEGEFVPPATGGDRKTLYLHQHDVELIKAAASLSENVVVVMTSGQIIQVENFVDSVRAILWIGYPGPMGGQALADILVGDVNPSGRTTSVTPKRAEDYVPAGFTLEPWAAGPEVQYPYSYGFKHMWEAGIEPRYPIGFGLSYTTFSFAPPTLSVGTGFQELLVRIKVTNTAGMAGIETVQVYGTCPKCSKKRLPIHLLGFAKTPSLTVGETAEVEVAISAKELAIFDVATEEWLLEKGTYNLLVGPYLDRKKLQTLDHKVKADVRFTYPGAVSPPDVPDIGTRVCNKDYTCIPDEDFNKEEFLSVCKARAAWLLILGFQILSMCCCYRLCGRVCCRKSDSRAKEE